MLQMDVLNTYSFDSCCLESLIDRDLKGVHQVCNMQPIITEVKHFQIDSEM